jgi:hypothetical protein
MLAKLLEFPALGGVERFDVGVKLTRLIEERERFKAEGG